MNQQTQTKPTAVPAVQAQPPVPVPADGHGAITITGLDEAWRLAGHMAKSTAIPKSLIHSNYEQTQANVFVSIQYGAEIGLKPMQAVQNIAVVNGLPSLWGDGMRAVVVASSLCKYLREGVDRKDPKNHTTWVGWCESERTDNGEKLREEFSWDDAVRAGLAGKDTYRQYPQRMLQARARSWCCRGLYPDVLKGIGSAEEQQDLEYTRGADGTYRAAPVGDRPETESSSKSTVDDGGVVEGVVENWGVCSASGQVLDVIPDGPQAPALYAKRLRAVIADAPDGYAAEILEANAEGLGRLRDRGLGDAADALKAMGEPPPVEESKPKAAAAAAAKPAATKAAKPEGAAPSAAKEPAPAQPPKPTEADVPADDMPVFSRFKGRIEKTTTPKGVNDIWQYEMSHGDLGACKPVTMQVAEAFRDQRLAAIAKKGA